MSKQQNTGWEWFYAGLTFIGFIWLYSRDWTFTEHLLTSWWLWGTIAFSALLNAFPASRASQGVTGHRVIPWTGGEGVVGDGSSGRQIGRSRPGGAD